MGFDLSNYESVEDRIPKFWADHPNGRMVTALVHHDGDEWVFRCELFRENETEPYAVGHAHEEKTQRGVNSTSACENCETSAIGRALAQAGYAAKGKRPSREEMAKTSNRGNQQQKGEAVGASSPAAVVGGEGGSSPQTVACSVCAQPLTSAAIREGRSAHAKCAPPEAA